MSRMQEALSRKDYDCAKPAVPVDEPCKPDTQGLSDKSCRGNTLDESDSRMLRSSSILRIVSKSKTGLDRRDRERTSRFKFPRIARTVVPGTSKQSKSRRVAAPYHGSVSAQPRPKERESVAAQIQRFHERADLRECLLPGMLGRISRRACEGWQRQTPAHNSRMLAKIKLEPCKGCQYGLEPDRASN